MKVLLAIFVLVISYGCQIIKEDKDKNSKKIKGFSAQLYDKRDFDGDLISNAEEIKYGLNPLIPNRTNIQISPSEVTMKIRSREIKMKREDNPIKIVVDFFKRSFRSNEKIDEATVDYLTRGIFLNFLKEHERVENAIRGTENPEESSLELKFKVQVKGLPHVTSFTQIKYEVSLLNQETGEIESVKKRTLENSGTPETIINRGREFESYNNYKIEIELSKEQTTSVLNKEKRVLVSFPDYKEEINNVYRETREIGKYIASKNVRLFVVDNLGYRLITNIENIKFEKLLIEKGFEQLMFGDQGELIGLSTLVNDDIGIEEEDLLKAQWYSVGFDNNRNTILEKGSVNSLVYVNNMYSLSTVGKTVTANINSLQNLSGSQNPFERASFKLKVYSNSKTVSDKSRSKYISQSYQECKPMGRDHEDHCQIRTRKVRCLYTETVIENTETDITAKIDVDDLNINLESSARVYTKEEVYVETIGDQILISLPENFIGQYTIKKDPKGPRITATIGVHKNSCGVKQSALPIDVPETIYLISGTEISNGSKE